MSVISVYLSTHAWNVSFLCKAFTVIVFVCRLKRTVKQLKEQVKQSKAAAEMYV